MHLQVYPKSDIQDQLKEGNRNYLIGDLTKDDSTWSSTYVKTLTIKEKFQY